MTNFTETEERQELRRQVAKLAKGYGRDWFVERARSQEPLVELASPLGEQDELRRAFDAFHDDGKSEIPGQAENRFDHDPIALACANSRDQTAIDLQRIERKAAEVGEARIARPEVVERDLDARLANLFEIACNGFEIAEKNVLRDLDRDPLGIDPGGTDGLQEPGDEAFLHDLVGQ